MKKLTDFFYAAALALAGCCAFSSCSDDEEFCRYPPDGWFIYFGDG